MKTFYFINILLMTYHTLYGQNDQKRVVGTLVYDHKIYNYEFVKEGTDVYSLVISSSNNVSSQNTSATSTSATSTSATSTSATSTSATSTSATSTSASENGIFHEFTKEIFVEVFKSQMLKKSDVSDRRAELEDVGTNLFFKIKTRLDFEDDEPLTAYLTLKRDTIVSVLLSIDTTNNYLGSLSKFNLSHKIDRVKIETEDGAIKNIIVKIVPNLPSSSSDDRAIREPLEFKNLFPISISGKFDPEYFSTVQLFCQSCGGIRGVTRVINLSTLLYLDINLENDKEDYSPANSNFYLSPKIPIRELRKEKRSKILEASVFSDFTGFDNSQPNGLLQIEARRKININTRFRLNSRTRKILSQTTFIPNSNNYSISIISPASLTSTTSTANRSTNTEKENKSNIKRNQDYFYYQLKVVNPEPKIDRLNNELSIADTTQGPTSTNAISSSAIATTITQGPTSTSAISSSAVATNDSIRNSIIKIPKSTLSYTYSNWFGSIEPKILFSKLEENNRYLPAEKNNDKVLVSPSDIFRYQLTSFGFNLNVYKVYYPQLKFSWTVPYIGAYWFRNSIISNSRNNQNQIIEKDTLKFVNSIYWQLGTNVQFKPDSRWGLTAGFNYIWINIWNKDVDLINKGGLIQYNLDAYLKTNDNNKLFFRFRLTHDLKSVNSNFTQIQLGYLIDIFQGAKQTTTNSGL